MAENILAYGEITILDLLDSATYIYYAENAEGLNPSVSPDGKDYIGIYSGKSLPNGQPEVGTAEYESIKTEIVWSKFTGEQGQPGTPITITQTSIEYTKTTTDYEKPENITTTWSTTMPTLNQGEYLWTRTTVTYSDGTNTTSYSKSYFGKDGQDGDAGSADAYRIEFSQEEILKFVNSLDENKKGIYSYSPEVLMISATKNGESLDEDESVQVIVNEEDISSFLTMDANNNYILGVKDYLNQSALAERTSFPFIVKIKKGTGENSQLKAVRPIICRNGLNSEMATFALHATGINAAIQSTRLAFDATGLTISNGGIRIVKLGEEEPVFESDKEGNIYLKGKISATEGYIGGIEIKDDNLVGNNNAYIISPQGIVANNITLRQGAVIENYLQLGNSYLYNPDAKNSENELVRPSTDVAYRAVLRSGNLLIKDTGYMTLGDISLFGGTDSQLAYISSRNSQWKIWEDGRAEFKDIYANNCHMGNTILEVNTIQSAGNLTVYADSWTLVGAEDNYFVIDNDPMITYFSDKPVVLFAKNEYYKMVSEVVVVEVEGQPTLYKIPVDRDVQSAGFVSGDVITKIGKEGEAVLCISGQGSNSTGFAKESSLTLSTLTSFTNNIPTFETRLSLGFLDKLGKSGISGYGLYAENVYLRGSLTTATSGEQASYAGINTTSGVTATIFSSTSVGGASINDSSRIIFWAGANPTGVNNEKLSEEEKMAEAIQKAPFQVTERGTLYAAQGVFEGSIISKSKIQGSDIYAARIHGWADGSKAALTIYDTAQGIVFKTGFQTDDEYETLKINSKGLIGKNGKPFIALEGTSNQTITFQGHHLKASDNNRQLVLSSTGLMGQVSDGEESWSTQAQMSLGEEFSFIISGAEVANFTRDLLNLKAVTTKMEQHVQFGENVNLLYKQVDAGYDLYVN